MINKLLIGLFVFMGYLSFGQSLDAIRLEVPSSIDSEGFHVEAIGVDGVLIFYVSNEIDNEKKRKWYFGLFDTGLKQQWLKFLPLTDNIEFVKSKRIKNNLYFLFKNFGRDRSDYGYYEIVTYDIKKQNFEKISGSIPSKAEIAGFEIIGNTACLALNLKKRATDLVFISLSSGDLTPVHIDEGTPGYIEALYADPTHGLFYVAMKQNKDRRYITDHLLMYSKAGILKSNNTITNTEPLKYFRDYFFEKNGKSELLIFGTYNIVTGKNIAFKDIEEDAENTSAGMFFLKFVDGKQTSLKYYDFMGFNNISGAIGPNNFTTSKLPDDSNSHGNNRSMVTASFNLSNPLIYKSENGNNIFSVEVFQPHYKTETRMDYDFYGRPYPYTYNVFSGYDFYDVIIASITNDGILRWSNDFVIDDVLTYSKSRKSVVFTDNNYITMAYVNNGNVVSQTIEGPADIDRYKTKIGSDFPQDRVTQDEFNHIVKWYGDYFLIYGYQKIKNRTLGEQATRVVFYANKIAYK